jgi:ADP-ribosylglycohydrolase
MNRFAVAAKFSIAGDTDTVAIVKNAMIDALVSEIDNSDNVRKESIEGYSIELATTETKNSLATIKTLFPEIL